MEQIWLSLTHQETNKKAVENLKLNAPALSKCVRCKKDYEAHQEVKQLQTWYLQQMRKKEETTCKF